MRHYSIFLIESDVAADYFGKEYLLYSLFCDYERTSIYNKEVTKKQVEYITEKIPFFQLQQFIQKQLNHHPGFHLTNDGFEVHCMNKGSDSFARLQITNQSITLSSEGNYEAETVFFETLRKFASGFLAMDYQADRYGWLNPIKQKKLVRHL